MKVYVYGYVFNNKTVFPAVHLSEIEGCKIDLRLFVLFKLSN